MAGVGVVKYECEICEERGFKSRADWLFHLVLDRHSVKARESMQQLYLSSNGNLFVLSGIGEVDNTQILDYVAVKIRSFSNFVSFRPQANVCIMVCDEGDFVKFAAVPHVIGGLQPKFKDYKEIPPVEWKSYFNQAQAGGGPQVKKEPDSDNSDNRNQTGGNNGPCTSSSSGSYNGSGKRIPITADWNDGRKLPKMEAHCRDETAEHHDTNWEGRGKSTNAPTNIGSTNWAAEIAEMEELIMMPEAERDVRQKAIFELRSCFRETYPKCEVVNVGADFLGFNLDRDELKLFVDVAGLTNPQNLGAGAVLTVLKKFSIKNAKQQVLELLIRKSQEVNGPVQDVIHVAGTTICFYVFGHFRLKCNLMFGPFSLAQTTLLCKKLFFTNPQSMFLIKMAVHWSIMKGFTNHGLQSHTYTIYWLVYFYLMQKQGLAPVIELQSSCPYQLIDQDMNVAVTYDASLLHEMATKNSASHFSAMTEEDVRSQIQLLLDWFVYMDETFGDKNGQPAANLRHCLICPRLGQLVDKRMFTVCREGQQNQNGKGKKKKKGKPRKMDSKQKNVRIHWEGDLTRLGFDRSTWEKIGKLELPNTLSIQHPLYINENISLAFKEPFAQQFFAAIKMTKVNLTRLLNGSPASLTEALTKHTKIKASRGKEEEDEDDDEDGSYSDSEDEDDPGSEEEVKLNPRPFWEDEFELEDPGRWGSNSQASFEDISNECKLQDTGQGETSSGLFLEDLVNQADAANTNITLPTLHPSIYPRWTNEINNVFESIMLSGAERNARTTVITQLKSMLKLKYPVCELIPVGADFLGLNVEKIFSIYFDTRGVTNPANPNRTRTVTMMSEEDVRILQHEVFVTLKKNSKDISGLSVHGLSGGEITKKDFTNDDGVTTVNFICIVDGRIQLSCSIFIRPFKLATTALLCKQLVLSNPQLMNLVAMVVYWTNMRTALAECCLPNPFVIFWLVHFFLVKKGLLPPALDLQKSCNYEILEKNLNVAFSVDPNILSTIPTPTITADNLISNVELLIEWFVHVDNTLDMPPGSPPKTPSVRKHCVISPRVGKLIFRFKFKSCKERFLYKTKKSGGAKEREQRTRWGQDLVDLGFDVNLWPSLARQRLRDKLVIQHPFYLADNIARSVKAPEAKKLFEAIRQTREKLLKLVRAALTQPNASLIETLST